MSNVKDAAKYMMTVQELIEQLKALPPEAKVILQKKDAEGNEYSPAVSAREGIYVPDTTWSGEFYEGGIGDAIEDGEVEPGEGEVAVVLWSIN